MRRDKQLVTASDTPLSGHVFPDLDGERIREAETEGREQGREKEETIEPKKCSTAK